jgi:hypothetical protein
VPPPSCPLSSSRVCKTRCRDHEQRRQRMFRREEKKTGNYFRSRSATTRGTRLTPRNRGSTLRSRCDGRRPKTSERRGEEEEIGGCSVAYFTDGGQHTTRERTLGAGVKFLCSFGSQRWGN